MIVNNVRALIPIQIINQPALPVERPDTGLLRRCFDTCERVLSPVYNKTGQYENYAPYKKRTKASVLKGGHVDIYA